MSHDHRLISLLVCPLCKGALQLVPAAADQPAELQCPADRLGFPIRDGIPVMLESEARALEAFAPPAPNPLAAALAPNDQPKNQPGQPST